MSFLSEHDGLFMHEPLPEVVGTVYGRLPGCSGSTTNWPDDMTKTIDVRPKGSTKFVGLSLTYALSGLTLRSRNLVILYTA